MSNVDLTKVKYYPDRFYVCLDGFDINNLTTFITDLNVGQNQAIFIHEYYHYLTNITSFPGIRQFNLNFCDRFRLVTILTCLEGINAYPITSNTFSNCKNHVDYWLSVTDMINGDDINYDLVTETATSTNKSFDIEHVDIVNRPMTGVVNGQPINGSRTFVNIKISGLTKIHDFDLTFGALDEFLSSAIDEYLFQNDISDIDPSTLSQRPFYPYLLFDKLLAFYGLKRVSALEKIIIVHFSLNCFNASVKIVQILTALQNGGYDDFQNDPEKYLIANFSEHTDYKVLLDNIKQFADQTFDQGRIHISQALRYYYDKFYTAQKLKETDPFYFIRPFMVADPDPLRMRQKFLLGLSRILNQFTPPVILKDGEFFYIDKLTTFGEATLLIIATYEIFESVKSQQIAKRPARLKAKYAFPGPASCDDLTTYAVPIYGIAFQLALNEVGLLKPYIEYRDGTVIP
jgi:hypothetical protein